MAWAHFFAGRYEESLGWAEAAVREQSNFLMAICLAAASAALAGRIEEARKTMARVRELNPRLSLSNLPIPRPADFSKWSEGVKKAGLPEWPSGAPLASFVSHCP